MVLRLVQQIGKSSPAHRHQRNERARIPELLVISTEQPPPQPKL